MRELISTIHRVHSWFIRAVNLLQSPLLLAIRLYWGWQFMQDGYGKLTHLDKVTQFFASLNLPAPGTTAVMVGSIELVGGFLFTFGIFTRLTSLVLFVNMTMAYLSVPDDRTNFFHVLSNPGDFYGATPYTYWFAALLILVFGPGLFAVDSILGYFARRKPAPLTVERTPPPAYPR
jgi:putative oxidoreductase